MKKLIALVFASACVPSLGSPDAGSVASDSGIVEPSLEPVVECQPLDHAGCDSASLEACVWSPEDDSTRCTVPVSHLDVGEPCYPGEASCSLGLTCTALRSDEVTSCYRVCDPELGVGCEPLMHGGRDYLCLALEGLRYGVCALAGSTCDPILDACSETEVCSLRGGQTACLAAGEVPIGGDCSTNGCAKGGLCLRLADRARSECFVPCDTAGPTCTSAEICTGLDGLSFGVCQPAVEACSPLDDRCEGGAACNIRGTGTGCSVPGSAAVGAACESDGCARGGVCARMVGEAGPRCHEPCDLGLPRCGNPIEECQDIGLSFGVCR